MQLVERFTSDQDRLVTALFLAALLHGLVILGIRFASPPADPNALPTLEVLLVSDAPEQEANLDASYIAQRNQRGSGTTTDRARPRCPSRRSGSQSGRSRRRGRAARAGRRRRRRRATIRRLSARRTAGAQRALAGSDRQDDPFRAGAARAAVAAAGGATMRAPPCPSWCCAATRSPAPSSWPTPAPRRSRATCTAGSCASSRWARSTSRTRRGAARCRATRCSR